jgi:hypothetical protein
MRITNRDYMALTHVPRPPHMISSILSQKVLFNH